MVYCLKKIAAAYYIKIILEKYYGTNMGSDV